MTDIDLSTDAPPSPERTLKLADTLAEITRCLNHATMHHEALRYPSEADRLLRHVETAVSRLPQLLQQVSSWLNEEYYEDCITMTGGEFLQPVLAVMAAEARLGKAAEHAGAFGDALASALSVTSRMAVPEDRS